MGGLDLPRGDNIRLDLSVFIWKKTKRIKKQVVKKLKCSFFATLKILKFPLFCN